ncbi:hypothetical protein TrVE_jg10158 [Triparma verrucosa]|uniref:TRAF3-interacting protein 1 N-terminal domain-containing protein n=1 Tax=Triparma verrucosa TaxID=1606542 RepID=A0A9W7BCE3_9STRA|nr:hypothetical protein TrVE_jg10158 [Triparma verrucosa]
MASPHKLPQAISETRRALENTASMLLETSESASPLPELTDKLLSRPPFAFLHSIVKVLVSSSPLSSVLSTTELSTPGNAFTRPQKLAFLIKLFEAISLITEERIDVFVVPAKVIAGQDVAQTLLFLRELAKSVKYPAGKINGAVESVKRDGEVKIYQRSVRVRNTVVRMQAIMRGKKERKLSMMMVAQRHSLPTDPTQLTCAPMAAAQHLGGAVAVSSKPSSITSTPRLSEKSSEEGNSDDDDINPLATLRGPRGSPLSTGPAPMMNLMEESVDLEDSNEQLNQSISNLPPATSTTTPATPPRQQAPRLIVPVSPLTPESPSANSNAMPTTTAPPSTLSVAKPKTQKEVEQEISDAHKTMQEEMKRMKVAMDKEKERQREMVQMRRMSKKERVKRDLLDQKYKLATKLKNVKAKEETLIKKENEIKKKEERVQKLADNLRRQRTQLKKEKAKPSAVEQLRVLAEMTPNTYPPPNHSHTMSPKKKLYPMQVKNDHNIRPPKIKPQAKAKLQKMMVTYDDVRGLAAKAGVPYELTKHVQEVSPPRGQNGYESPDEGESDTKLEMNMYKNMFISDPSLSPPSPAKSEISPKTNLSAYKTAPMASIMPLESNPFMSQQPKMPSPIPAPSSVASQKKQGAADSAKMYDKWLGDYNSSFEEAMRRNGEKLREQSESHVGLEKLKAKRVQRNNRSSSAKDKNKADTEKDYDESGSSRESRSAPEESRRVQQQQENSPFVPASDSMALLVGDNSKRPTVKKNKKSSPIRKAPKKRGIRSKKKTPTRQLKPRQSSTSPKQLKAKAKEAEETIQLPPRVPLPQQQESLRKLNQVIGRKRVRLIDLLPSAMGNNITLTKFEADIENLLQQNGFSKHLEGLIVAVEARCMNEEGGVDIRALEAEMRNPASVLKSLKSSANTNPAANGDGQPITKKSVAKKVYKDFAFSFEREKENGNGNGNNQENEDEEQRWWEELVREENRLNEENKAEASKLEKQGAKANPWLQSFDKRMSEALGRFEREQDY